MIIDMYRSLCKIPVILVRFLRKFDFFSRFSINTQISNITKLRPAGTKLFHEDGQTDMKKLIVAFRNFAKAPKN